MQQFGLGLNWVKAGFFWDIAGFAGIKVLNAEFWFKIKNNLSYTNRKYVGICYYITDPKINYKFLHRGFSKIVLQMENIHWVTDL